MSVIRSAAQILADLAASSTPAGPEPEPEFMTTKQVADLFDVGRETVRRWVYAGALTEAYRTGGGHRRFRASEVRALRALLGATATPTRGQVAWVVATVAAAGPHQTSTFATAAAASPAAVVSPGTPPCAGTAAAAVPGGSEGGGGAGTPVRRFRASPPTSHPAIGGRGEGSGSV